MSEEHLIRHCAPTLAGLKTGSLFACPAPSPAELQQSIRNLNHRLLSRGLRVIPLRQSHGSALIYVYRPKRLRSDLSREEATRILRQQGYDTSSCVGCIAQLMRRLRCQEAFPHEIGLFLGYPPEDVSGFMENRACGCKCVGCWKVYGDEQAAKKKFAQYKKCTRVYRAQWEKGKDIERLTVAG